MFRIINRIIINIFILWGKIRIVERRKIECKEKCDVVFWGSYRNLLIFILNEKYFFGD